MASMQQLSSVTSTLFLFLPHVVPVSGHGFLSIPPSRNLGNSPKNGYCEHCGNGNTNVCGDGNQWPSSSNYVQYTNGPVTAVSAGGVLEVEVVITAHHKGHMEFSICESQINGGAAEANQDCLNTHVLERVPPEEIHGSDCLPNDARPSCQPLDELHPERFYLPPPRSAVTTLWTTHYNGKDVYQLQFYLPSNLTCNGKCTLQWRWWTANSCYPKPDYKCYFDKIKEKGWNSELWCGSYCGTCTEEPSSPNTYQAGCGEEFANCADIEIITSGPTESTTPAPTPAPCGDCSACQAPDGSMCYSDRSLAWCAQMGYTWCGPLPTPAPTFASTPAPSSPTPEPTPAPPGTGCRAIPGMNAGATDSNCAQCAEGYQWWPCNSEPPICDCSGGTTIEPEPTPEPTPEPEPTPDSAPIDTPGTPAQAPEPTPADTAAPTPAGPESPASDFCGTCQQCKFRGNGVCYPDASKSYCDAFGDLAEWCGPSSLAQGRVEHAQGHTAKVRRHLRRSARLRRGEGDDASMMQLHPSLAAEEDDGEFEDDFEDADEREGVDEL